MITSVWLLSIYLGGILSSVAGGVLYDIMGFSWSTALLVILTGITVHKHTYILYIYLQAMVSKGTNHLSQVIIF